MTFYAGVLRGLQRLGSDKRATRGEHHEVRRPRVDCPLGNFTELQAVAGIV